MSSDPTGFVSDPEGGAGDPPAQLTEEELRAAYEEELRRITPADLALQAAVSLLNLGGRRLGLTGAPGESAEGERDLEQVRDAIDGVRALLGVLERRRPDELRALRDALSQLQVAYAREAGAVQGAKAQPSAGQPDAPSGAPPRGGTPEGGAVEDRPGAEQEHGPGRKPGPAESSGRLWVPGR
jgi:hypothetical protein